MFLYYSYKKTNKTKTNNQLKLPEAESFPFQGHLRVHVSTACSIAGRFLGFFYYIHKICELWMCSRDETEQ